MNLNRLRVEVHNRVLALRSIEAILQTDKFKALWEQSNELERGKVEWYALSFDKDGLTRWMKNHSSLRLQDKGIDHLRTIGSKLKIRNYSRLSKTDLLKAIKDKQCQSKSHT